MLTSEERARIAREITSADQDYFVWTGLLGEPFLHDGVLCFYDGDTAAVVGHELGCRWGDSRVPSRVVTEVLAEWAGREDVGFINYCGPGPAAPLPRDRWSLIHSAGPEPWNQEVFLGLRRPDPLRYTWEIRGQLRRAARRGLRVTLERREFLGHEHIRLLRDLTIGHHLIASSASYLANIVSILRSEATAVWEARTNGALAGFTVTHEFFEQHPFLVVAVSDRSQPGTSDALYAAMIEHYRDRCACELGLGCAVGEGLYRFKVKWPGAVLAPPCRQFIWQRVGSRARYADCLYWPWRLVGDAVGGDVATHDSRWLPRYQRHAVDAVRVPVPDIAQRTDARSGIAALMSVCRYFGVGPEDDLDFAKDLSPDHHAWPDPERLVAAAVRYGLCASTCCPMSTSELRGFLSQRKPVVILVQAWGKEEDGAPRAGYLDTWDDDHYLVGIGYDHAGMVFEDPALQGVRGFLTWEELERRWHARGPGGAELRRFGAAIWMPQAQPAAYLSRGRFIM